MRLARAVGIAVAVAAISSAGVAHAQTAADTPDPNAVKRLEELLAAMNTGDAERLRRYLQANTVDPRTGAGWSAALLPMMHELYRISTGFELIRVTTIPAQQFQPRLAGYTVGILRNKATGDEHALSIDVELLPPYRINGTPVLHPSLAAMLARPAAASARSEPAQLQEIGAYLKRLADADVFSGVVVITRDGEPVFSQAYDYADREKKIPNTLATPFMLGSMNKLFSVRDGHRLAPRPCSLCRVAARSYAYVETSHCGRRRAITCETNGTISTTSGSFRRRAASTSGSLHSRWAHRQPRAGRAGGSP